MIFYTKTCYERMAKNILFDVKGRVGQKISLL